jgi:hypothetical protein
LKINLFLIAIFFILLPGVIYAQTAAELETVMNTKAVTCVQAASFVLRSAGTAISEGTPFQQAVNNGWLRNSAENDPITMEKLSYLIMAAFNMRGGVMYRLIPGPRYAYRSMVSNSYIQGNTDPRMTVSGERFLLVLGKVMNDSEDQ